MSTPIELPDWLEACRPDDDLYADAYEGTPAELRALLKTAIAFSFHRWPLMDDETRTGRASSRSGFRHSEASRPAGWVIASLGPGFASPARLLAALVPAIIAGAGPLVIVSEAPFSPAVCTALELAGLEDSFLLDTDQMPGLYEDLRALDPDGRVLAFPGADGAFTDAQKELLHSAALDGLPRLRDLPAPRLLCLHEPGSEAEARLRWLHPDAEFLHEAAPGLRAAFVPAEDACPAAAHEPHSSSATWAPHAPATSHASAAPGAAPLAPRATCDSQSSRAPRALRVPFICGPGMEACWPGPSPEFYRSLSCSAFLFQENDPETLP